jgi:hypothetical protein
MSTRLKGQFTKTAKEFRSIGKMQHAERGTLASRSGAKTVIGTVTAGRG